MKPCPGLSDGSNRAVLGHAQGRGFRMAIRRLRARVPRYRLAGGRSPKRQCPRRQGEPATSPAASHRRIQHPTKPSQDRRGHLCTVYHHDSAITATCPEPCLCCPKPPHRNRGNVAPRRCRPVPAAGPVLAPVPLSTVGGYAGPFSHLRWIVGALKSLSRRQTIRRQRTPLSRCKAARPANRPAFQHA